MHQILFTYTLLGREHVIGTYGVCAAVAAAAAYLFAYALSKAAPFKGKFPYDVILLVIVGGLIGAFIIGLILSLPIRSADEIMLVSWGGIIGGVAAFWLACKFWQIPAGAFADLAAPVYLLGIGIGRIGCLFGGCCFGVHTDSACGITFVDPAAPASAGLQPLVPVQIISAAYLITGAAIFAMLYLRKSRTSGSLFCASALFYSTGRFIIEFWRDDYRRFLLGFSDGQIFSAVLFVSACASLIIIRQKQKKQNAI